MARCKALVTMSTRPGFHRHATDGKQARGRGVLVRIADWVCVILALVASAWATAAWLPQLATL